MIAHGVRLPTTACPRVLGRDPSLGFMFRLLQLLWWWCCCCCCCRTASPQHVTSGCICGSIRQQPCRSLMPDGVGGFGRIGSRFYDSFPPVCAVGEFRALVDAAERDRALCDTLKRVLKLSKVSSTPQAYLSEKPAARPFGPNGLLRWVPARRHAGYRSRG